MAWPGSTWPSGTKPRRRRSKSGKRRNGPSSTERLMLATARSLGIAPKAKRTTDAVGRCLDHASRRWVHVAHGTSRLRRLAGRTGTASEETPEARSTARVEACPTPCRAVVAIRCKACSGTGRGCGVCTGYGWGVVLKMPIKTGACVKHQAAPTTPATSAAAIAASAPTAPSPALDRLR